MNRKKLFLFGGGGHALTVKECIDDDQFELTGYFATTAHPKNLLNLQYFGDIRQVNISEIVGDGVVFPAFGNNHARFELQTFCKQQSLAQTTLIHRSAIVSSSAIIKSGTLISLGAIVNADTKIGNGVIINTGVIIEHECKIGDCSHIAPGSVLCGNVSVGERSFIGANSTVKEDVTIGSDVIIGAGSTVVCDIPDGETWFGTPAKRKK